MSSKWDIRAGGLSRVWLAVNYLRGSRHIKVHRSRLMQSGSLVAGTDSPASEKKRQAVFEVG